MAAILVNNYLLFPMNWETDMSFRKEWRTNILKTLTGIETRSSLYTFSRRSLMYAMTFFDTAEGNYLKRNFYRDLHKIWGVPIWMDETTLSSSATSGQPILSVVSTDDRNFEVGGLCGILKANGAYEVGEISSFTSTSITLSVNLTLSWDSGDIVVPIMKAVLSVSQDMSNLTDRSGTLSLEAKEVVDPYITHYVPSVASFPTYEGHSIFNISVNYGSELETVLNHDFSILQSIGIAEYGSTLDETSITLSREYGLYSKSEITEFINFFDVMKGMWDNFWVSSAQNDIVVTVAFLSTDTILNVEPIYWEDYWEINNNTGKYLNFKFPDGTEIQRQIIDEPTSSQLTLDSALGKACTTAELKALTVSFLYFARFDMDQMELNYVTDSIATVLIKFETVPLGDI